MTAQVVIAARGGPTAKTRLRGAINGAALTVAMLRDMVAAIDACSGVSKITLVTPTPEIGNGLPVEILADAPNGDLNAAFRRALATLPAAGTTILLPGDLPQLRAEHLTALLGAHRGGGVTVVRSRFDAGTGAIVLRPDQPFVLAFGVNSFSRHIAQRGARRFECAAIGDDLDRPEDLQRVLDRVGPHTRACIQHKRHSLTIATTATADLAPVRRDAASV